MVMVSLLAAYIRSYPLGLLQRSAALCCIYCMNRVTLTMLYKHDDSTIKIILVLLLLLLFFKPSVAIPEGGKN